MKEFYNNLIWHKTECSYKCKYCLADCGSNTEVVNQLLYDFESLHISDYAWICCCEVPGNSSPGYSFLMLREKFVSELGIDHSASAYS